MAMFRDPVPLVAVLAVLVLVAAAGPVAAGPCSTQAGVCYPGNDLLHFNESASAADCCAKCQNWTECVAFTFRTAHGCFLKSAAGKPGHDADCTSGLSGHAPPPPPPPPVPHPSYCTSTKCYNVLYLLSDDMRAEWGSYGLPAITPNLDKLAQESLLFTRAYCQFSVCAPSRMSFMTSRRPDTFGVWNFIDTVPKTTQATPGYFRDYNYITLGLGKTFHQDSGAWNAAAYWSNDLPYYPYQSGKCPHGGEGGGHCVQTDEQIYDYHLRLNTIKYLKYATNKSKATGRPFYLMSGFRKPHAPWQAPQRMYDLYNESSLAVAKHKVLPTGTPLIAWSRQLNVMLENGTSFPYDPFHPVPDWVIRDQRHAYYAAVSYVDEHVGAILDTLKASGLYDDTIIVFHADHGYHLAEHGLWEKKSNFDLTVRVPLLIRVPGKQAAMGVKTNSLTELIDVFPTVATLAGLPTPTFVDGTDVSKLLDDPTLSLKPAAYHQYPACKTPTFNSTRQGCNNTPKNEFTQMGYSVRTDAWRYTGWFDWDNATLKAEWDGKFAEELYTHYHDYSTEMDNFENVNQAASNATTAAELHTQLVKFFQEH